MSATCQRCYKVVERPCQSDAERADCSYLIRNQPATPLHPFCTTCGWRKGGIDSWNGRACKCGLYAPPMPVAEPS